MASATLHPALARCGWLPPPGSRVLVALSGGVDSAVAAALLTTAGYEVIAATMKTWDEYRDRGEVDPQRAERGCCSMAAVADCLAICDVLHLPYHLLDLQEPFRAAVVTPFIAAYGAGRTPSPCVPCNAELKFGRLLEEADRLACAAIATGHYARRVGDAEPALWRGVDASRDQAYYLATLRPAALARACFPLGAITKAATRALARELKLPVAEKGESREICFVHDDYRRFLARAGGPGGEPGLMVDTTGRVVGRHTGIRDYTLGQRRHLGIAAAAPYYVVALRPATNEVVVGPAACLDHRKIEVEAMNWLAPLPANGHCTAQIRATAPATAATFEAHGDRLRLTFATPVRAPAPGQTVALFTGDRLLGGGTLARVVE